MMRTVKKHFICVIYCRDYHENRNRRRGSESPERPRESRSNWDRETVSPHRRDDKYKRDEDDDKKIEKKKNQPPIGAAKKAPPPTTSSSSSSGKGKLPFIGRLPLFKKKEDSKPEITAVPYVQSKFENTPQVPADIINPPGMNLFFY